MGKKKASSKTSEEFQTTTAAAKKASASDRRSGRFDYEGLDRVLHEKARLGLMTCLVGTPDGLTFGELKELCNLTDGNLNRHLKQLSDAELISVARSDSETRRQTIVTLTASGRKRFVSYLSELQRVIGDAEQQMRSRSSTSTRRLATD